MITTDMESWVWSSWILFSMFLFIAFALGFVVRDTIQQYKDRKQD